MLYVVQRVHPCRRPPGHVLDCCWPRTHCAVHPPCFQCCSRLLSYDVSRQACVVPLMHAIRNNMLRHRNNTHVRTSALEQHVSIGTMGKVKCKSSRGYCRGARGGAGGSLDGLFKLAVSDLGFGQNTITFLPCIQRDKIYILSLTVDLYGRSVDSEPCTAIHDFLMFVARGGACCPPLSFDPQVVIPCNKAYHFEFGKQHCKSFG